jgi:NAD(P)-dependent dehydrogenase (short-subunit alcohol dehydrogenase family)
LLRRCNPGIGAAVARGFAEAGCRALAITDIDGKKLLSTKDYIISKHEAVTVLTATGDIADEKFVQSFVDGVIAEVGRLDFAVCFSL